MYSENQLYNKCQLNPREKYQSCGLSLVEIMIGITIIGVCVGPIFQVFLMSRKYSVSASEIANAMTMASSYATAINSIASEQITAISHLEDMHLPPPFDLDSLSLSPCVTGFNRFLNIVSTPEHSTENPQWLAVVTVRWNSNVTRTDREYSLHSILGGE